MKQYTLITGATGGLGNAFCYELAKKNSPLLLTGTKQEKLNNLVQELRTAYANLDIITFPCDLSNEVSRKNFFEFINSNNIEINMLINNAGYITEGAINNSTPENLITCIRVNCEGVIDLTKFILDRKKENSHLNIITISSLAGDYPMPYMAIYSATKAFETNFMTSLRNEYKHKNVNVLVVKPGAIPTSQSMKDAIKAQGLKGKLSSVNPAIIAQNSIKKSWANKKTYIPGFFNKFTSFVSKFASQNFQAKIIARMWKKSQQKRHLN